ncbi:hypothetical protein PP935_gp069 [Rhizobium phage RHph_N34]|uniref:Uncharacterized protein n=2 Tax=Trinifflemingvirus TaxID=3044848 RepID=A0A7S5UXL8_9CAUD|nr:hypothetical protein PP935_gp069 [Rhizobium phage RHph_N34]YP_010661704.1 hypothetical protein PP936_gp066 [Rhizobium phage RHph_I1_9]QIG69636.1 hypothetical protein EVB81_067 [Rhizobium phage RHph_I46]QIG70917.1 hypothetical protein EVB92_067 [Rhizobium phage RHph_I9]QIG76256.1 hypothetical protein EVC25_067 [Rhizobium phage RHph_I34]QIG73503.1 hypothetical protein EVC04_066 [Rhizobium phage RHph_I1_9]QIG73844.1 hypothetical protein EVC06_069 [Rhizobium phage RHph_N34]
MKTYSFDVINPQKFVEDLNSYRHPMNFCVDYGKKRVEVTIPEDYFYSLHEFLARCFDDQITEEDLEIYLKPEK